MKQRLRWAYPFFLLALCGLAYGLWIGRLGFYWDDFPLAWIARTYGGEGLGRYFSTNRPFWGLLYRLTTPLLGANPLAWQIFALFWRWVCALLVWQLVRRVWPRQEDASRWAGAIFLVYPGFSEQFIALVYSHFFIVLAAFLGSLVLMSSAARRGPGWRWKMAAALLLSALNLLCMEYFFLLDLLRPLLLWVVLAESDPLGQGGLVRRARQVLEAYAPFLAIFLAVMIWRSVFFGFHTYQPTFATQLRSAPLAALSGLALRMAQDLWLTAGQAWAKPFDFAALARLTARQAQIFWLVAGAGSLGSLAYLWLDRRAEGQPRRRDGLSLLLAALLALLCAGGAFWLTDLPISLTFHTDRFTISFLLGAALLAAGGLALLPLPRWLKLIPLALALGFGAAQQYHNSIAYYRDWSVQRTLFWQMTWRMPGLKPGTILLFNELALEHYSDNSLTAPLNWIYAPENRSEQMDYVLYYPTVRLGSGLPRLEKGLAVVQDYLAAEFRGGTSQVVVLYSQPPGCMRVMDPEVEADTWLVPPSLRETLKLASTAPIEAQGDTRPPAGLYGPEPQRGWCYYFEKADLARQQQDWASAAALGDAAFALKDYPNDPVERFPFLEAYAHVGRWTHALELTRDSKEIAPLYAQLGCKLWARIARETAPGAEHDAAVREAKAVLGCAP